MSVIQIEHVTKDYGDHKGVFDISISIQKGEVYGYLGPNGAGKTTTIRHLMGFSKADTGIVKINGMDCWTKQKQIQTSLGYLPGEIAFPNDMNGRCYIDMVMRLRGMKDPRRSQELLTLFEIDANMSLKRMSKGMKQKIGIVTAFMHEPSVILLDEPTSGLDPLMQNRFLELVEEERRKGKTILMSSHIFEEVEKTCDRIGMIKNGKIIQEFDAKGLKRSRKKSYELGFSTMQDLQQIKQAYPEAVVEEEKLQLHLSLSDAHINELIQRLSKVTLLYLKEEKHTLEEYFMQYYGGEHHD